MKPHMSPFLVMTLTMHHGKFETRKGDAWDFITKSLIIETLILLSILLEEETSYHQLTEKHFIERSCLGWWRGG